MFGLAGNMKCLCVRLCVTTNRKFFKWKCIKFSILCTLLFMTKRSVSQLASQPASRPNTTIIIRAGGTQKHGCTATQQTILTGCQCNTLYGWWFGPLFFLFEVMNVFFRWMDFMSWCRWVGCREGGGVFHMKFWLLKEFSTTVFFHIICDVITMCSITVIIIVPKPNLVQQF